MPIYDHFAPFVVFALEDYGFVDRGEGGPFTEGGRIEIGGALPVLTSGGGLSEAYVHGFNLINEGVRQMRGTSTCQVEGAEIGLCAGGPGVDTVSDLIDDLERQYPGMRDRLVEESGELRRFINIYVNQEDIRFLQGEKTALKQGDEVSIVPAIAGGHHEHLDGSGYPLGLAGEALPLGARLLAIADVFEALTAHDRPYKPAKTIGEALAIMRDMVARGHLDGELFERFVAAGIPEDYGRRFLKPEQLGSADRHCGPPSPGSATPCRPG